MDLHPAEVRYKPQTDAKEQKYLIASFSYGDNSDRCLIISLTKPNASFGYTLGSSGGMRHWLMVGRIEREGFWLGIIERAQSKTTYNARVDLANEY